MSFMKPEVFKGRYYEVETDNGTEVVPVSVSGEVLTILDLSIYVEGKIEDLDQEPKMKTGWLGRYSASGYLDCTPWSAFPSEKCAYRELKEMYGDEDEDLA